MRRPSPDATYLPELDNSLVNKAIMRAFAKELIKELVDNPDGVYFPASIGTMRIIGEKKRAIDFKTTKELGYPVFHQNYHTEGLTFTPVMYFLQKDYRKKRVANLFYTFYTFKPYKQFTKELERSLQTDKWRDYNTKVKFIK